jgi:U32 family peptidase
MGKKYELLAPVGNFAMLQAAIEAGAGAVYFGLKEFNMRASARNFSIIDLRKINEVCEKKGVKKYLTLNVVIYDGELGKLDKLFKKIKGKVDAVICWDLSVINMCRKYKIPFHVSTQASISNVKAAEFYKKLGAERVVLARELNLKQIKNIAKKAKVEVECFCHGAMCVSISGRCFTSQFLHGLSANRGECAQPCRRAYSVKDSDGRELKLENSRVMSAKDLCTLPFIDKMKNAGIVSFKIEGRNRNPEYVFKVVKEYRKALDKKLSRKEIVEGLEELKKVYNRSFSSGFYVRMPTSDDFSFSENGEQTEKKTYVARVEKYWPKAKAASVKMHHGTLKVGDEVYLMGDDTGIKRLKIESLEVQKKTVEKVKKGDDVGIRLPVCNKGDEIYKISLNS